MAQRNTFCLQLFVAGCLLSCSTSREILYIDVGSTSGDNAEAVTGTSTSKYFDSVLIRNASSSEVYRSYREGQFSYEFESISAGNYVVTLGFAALEYCFSGGRIFDVYIQGRKVLTEFDIFAQTGKCGTALTIPFHVEITFEGDSLISEFRSQNATAGAVVSMISVNSTEPSSLSTSAPAHLPQTSTSSASSNVALSTTSPAVTSQEASRATLSADSLEFHTGRMLSTFPAGFTLPWGMMTLPTWITAGLPPSTTRKSTTTGPEIPTSAMSTSQTMTTTELTSARTTGTIPAVSPATIGTTTETAVTAATATEALVTAATTTKSTLSDVLTTAAPTLSASVSSSTSSKVTTAVVERSTSSQLGTTAGNSTETTTSRSTSSIPATSVFSSTSTPPTGLPSSTFSFTRTPIFDIDVGSSTDTSSVCEDSGSPRKYQVTQIPGEDASSDPRIGSHRYGEFACRFAFSTQGVYNIELAFGEIYAPNCEVGARVFSVLANGVPVLEDFDVFKESGGRCGSGVYKTFPVTSSLDGYILISMTRSGGVENPMVSSIVITPTFNMASTSPILGTFGPTQSMPSSAPSSSDGLTTIATSNTSSSSEALKSSSTYSTGLELLDRIVVNAGSGNGENRWVTCTSACEIKRHEGIQTIEGGTFEDRSTTQRSGSSFFYEFPMKAGVYDITLQYAEIVPAYCSDGARVFSVAINDMRSEILQSIDVFKSTGKCYKEFSQTIQLEVENILKIEFTGIKKEAFISGVTVVPAPGCVLKTGGNGGSDHRAHAVPGVYPLQLGPFSDKAYTDYNGDGFETVFIDGYRSHTHYQDFSDPDNPIAGEVVAYKWTNLDSGEVISSERSFWRSFPLGTTSLLLEIRDSTCDRHEAETTVTVAGARSPGAYSYYYSTTVALEGYGIGSDSNMKPTYAREKLSGFSGYLDVPDGFAGIVFAVRCVFFYEVDSPSSSALEIDTRNTGSAQLFKGSSLVLDSVSTRAATVVLSVGLASFEVTYLRTNTLSRPFLGLSINGTAISASKIYYDKLTVLPVISSVSPGGSSTNGGVELTVQGYGFHALPYVSFGSGSLVRANPSGHSTTSFRVTTPPMDEGTVKLSVRSGPETVESNSLNFQFGDVPPPIKFTRRIVQNMDGSKTNNKLGSCISVWGGDWYVGTLGGYLLKLEVDENYVTQSSCRSVFLSDDSMKKPDGTVSPVSIFGLTFDPKDTVGRPFVSVVTSYWWYAGNIDTSNKNAWKNGRIVRLKMRSGRSRRVCMDEDYTVVSGLPVSDHDHGVNGMQFDNDGDLLVSVGGATNAGLPHPAFGSAQESPLSSAILRVWLSLGSAFDGSITYDQDFDNHQIARQLSGDVSTYATGFRNSWDMAFTSKGELFATGMYRLPAQLSISLIHGRLSTPPLNTNSLYVSLEYETTDNGANYGYGHVRSPLPFSRFLEPLFSRPSDTLVLSFASFRMTLWYRQFPRNCAENSSTDGNTGYDMPDKIVKVIEGGYYGHPNINRGECQFISPVTDLDVSVPPREPDPSLNYVPDLMTTLPSCNGIIEYTSSHFGSALKNELIVTNYAVNDIGLVQRVVPGQRLTLDESWGGLSVAQGIFGELIFSRVGIRRDLKVLEPDYPRPSGLSARTVSPFRGGRAGGLKIFVTGHGFGSGSPTVLVNDANCPVVPGSVRETSKGSLLQCISPRNPGSENLVDVVVRLGNESSTISDGFMYTN